MDERQAKEKLVELNRNPDLGFCPLINGECKGVTCVCWYGGQIGHYNSEFKVHPPGCGNDMFFGEQ